MAVTLRPDQLFTNHRDTYQRFIRAVFYPQGLRSFFLASPVVRDELRVLDAGCGTGAVTLALREAMARRHVLPRATHGFDLTPAMLDLFRETLRKRAIEDVALAQANVLDLSTLPTDWVDYDLIVSASMLEYVARDKFVSALQQLRSRLANDGVFLLFITRRNPLTRLLIGHWWQSNLYTAKELAEAFRAAGFSQFGFRNFPLAAANLSLWGHIVEARY